ncbi:MAG: hypothetical protein N2037_02535 [Acidimicrobiales bacterium]|nr:hypothetical protein [Acidimicrobiales bacterium]
MSVAVVAVALWPMLMCRKELGNRPNAARGLSVSYKQDERTDWIPVSFTGALAPGEEGMR